MTTTRAAIEQAQDVADAFAWNDYAKRAGFVNEAGVSVSDGSQTAYYAYIAARKDLRADHDARVKALEGELVRVRHTLRMISIVDQGCGGNLSWQEMAESAMRQARAALSPTTTKEQSK